MILSPSLCLAQLDLEKERPKTDDQLKKAIKKAKGYKTNFNVGLGIGQQSDLFIGGNPNIPVIPVVGFKYKNFYGFGITLGYTFYWGWPTLSLAVMPELISLEPEVGQETEGLTTRRSTLNAGLKAIFPTKQFIATLDIFHDTLNRYDGLKVNLDINRPFKISKKFQVIAGLGLNWVSSNYTDYYFGVTAQEVARAPSGSPLSVFNGEQAFQGKAQLVAIYDLSKRTALVLIEEFTHLPSQISDSPIVAKDYINRLYATITYSF